ncbi:hypothetical protein HDF10_002056 [Edaphobacter lichenicola]|uniref:Uncharacterized protein n=1 Tax=Tunturiibacter lichenicola TaxID=2051959 RepID=A0A7W8J7G8_9BACT|nr:hypothetical protein [Edaphobacter lichenicola]
MHMGDSARIPPRRRTNHTREPTIPVSYDVSNSPSVLSFRPFSNVSFRPKWRNLLLADASTAHHTATTVNTLTILGNPKSCQAPNSPKPAPALQIRVAYQLASNSYT